jgi:hypothetical protein
VCNVSVESFLGLAHDGKIVVVNTHLSDLVMMEAFFV